MRSTGEPPHHAKLHICAIVRPRPLPKAMIFDTAFQPRPSHARSDHRATPTLFLDFDGVLHPSLARTEDYFCRMPLLEKAIGGRTVDIIISSSWRLHYPLPVMMERFPATLRAAIIGTTGEPGLEAHARWHEILACVAHLDLQDWRALDDSRIEFPPDAPGLIFCNESVGLQAAQVEQVTTWLDRA